MYDPEKHIIGIDLGGTNIEGCLVDPETPGLVGKIISIPTFSNPEFPDSEEATHFVGDLIYELAKENENGVHRVGVSTPGIISSEGEILVGVVFGNFHIRKYLEGYIEKYGIKAKLHFENDHNCGAYAHGEGLTLMIGTNLGTALNIVGELVERNTERRDNWQEYSILDEGGYAIRLDYEQCREILGYYVNGSMFDSFFDELASENEDSPNLVRLEQLLGGNAIPRVFNLIYQSNYGNNCASDAPVDAKALHEITHLMEDLWEIEGRLLGYTVARLQKEAESKGYNFTQVHVGGKVSAALDHMKPFAEESARVYGAHDFELIKSPYDNPNIIGAAIAYFKKYGP